MSHISYSELKDWTHCPFYHKLTRVDKIDGFTGNEYTAFGSAIHSVCEKKLLEEEIKEDFFVKELKKNIAELDEDHEVNKKLVLDMIGQGKRIIPEIEKYVDANNINLVIDKKNIFIANKKNNITQDVAKIIDEKIK